MPQTIFSDDTLDSLLSTGNEPTENDYESLLIDDINPAPGDNPEPASPTDHSLTQYLQEDLRQRREEMQRRQEEAQRTQLAEAQRQQAEARAQRQRDLDARLDSVFRTPEAPNLTPEERQEYSDALPIIQRLAEYQSRQAVAGLRDTVREALAGRMELEEQLAALQQSQRADPRSQLDTLVRAQVPDIDATLSSPGWAGFRDTVIPALGLTPGQIIQSHYQSGNAQGVVSVLNLYKNRSKTTRAETAVPGQPAASGPSSRPSGRGMLRYSELNAAYDRADQGLLSRDKLAVIVDKFETAAAEGRVAYDK